jgi:hypothetical protein
LVEEGELNPGPIEETAKVAHSLIDVWRSQPLALALIVLSFALVGLLYYQSSAFTVQRRENAALFIKLQAEVQQLLARCVVPGGPG